jgi:hypothetical protein
MCFYTPLLCWLDIKRTVRYIENWIEFQVQMFADFLLLNITVNMRTITQFLLVEFLVLM